MFGKCWSIPCPGPSLPTVITVQAPAGIGKTSMLKYMCMKWGCQELWTDNFDVLLFVECRTLNRFVLNLLLQEVSQSLKRFALLGSGLDCLFNFGSGIHEGYWRKSSRRHRVWWTWRDIRSKETTSESSQRYDSKESFRRCG